MRNKKIELEKGPKKHGWRGRRETLSSQSSPENTGTTIDCCPYDIWRVYARFLRQERSLIMGRTNDFYRIFCRNRGFEKGTPNSNFAREFRGLGREDTLKV